MKKFKTKQLKECMFKVEVVLRFNRLKFLSSDMLDLREYLYNFSERVLVVP
jgi:hypothetical protein